MKKLLFLIGSAFLSKYLSPSLSSDDAEGSLRGQAKLNMPLITSLAKKYLVLAATGAFFTLFFVAGAMMAIYATALSFEINQGFIAGPVFYTGLGISFASLLATSLCILSGRRTKVSVEQLYYFEEAAPKASHGIADLYRFAEPVISGLFANWAYRKQKNLPKKERTDEGMAQPAQVRDIRAS